MEKIITILYGHGIPFSYFNNERANNEWVIVKNISEEHMKEIIEVATEEELTINVSEGALTIIGEVEV